MVLQDSFNIHSGDLVEHFCSYQVIVFSAHETESGFYLFFFYVLLPYVSGKAVKIINI